jgi:CubicO group peptidase (beta-lactamase class C family)
MGFQVVTSATEFGYNACDKFMTIIRFIAIISLWLAFAFPGRADEDLGKLLEPIQKKYNLPSIAAVILNSKGITSSHASGVRKVGTDIVVTTDDQWHLGSCTKTMTATLVGLYVEKGKLRWDTKLVEIFPDLADKFDPGLKDITVVHLLAHSAGLARDVNYKLILERGGSVQTERINILKEAVAKPPEYPPGIKHLYSNAGYIILGAVLEKVSGSTWEEMVQKELFLPLDMKSAGFGGTGTPGKIDQPWGHYHNDDLAKTNGPKMDNPPHIGPAGTVHCTLQDWAKFVSDQLRGARGADGILKGATYLKLQSPAFNSKKQACGWGITNNDIVGDRVWSHLGSNNMNFAYAVMVPSKDFAVLVVTNKGGDITRKACGEAIDALLTYQMEKLKPAK